MHDSIMSIFNNNVRRLLQKKGWTIKALAEKVGMHREALSYILNGHVDTSMGNGHKIADALGTTLAALVTEPPKPTKSRKREPQAAA